VDEKAGQPELREKAGQPELRSYSRKTFACLWEMPELKAGFRWSPLLSAVVEAVRVEPPSEKARNEENYVRMRPVIFDRHLWTGKGDGSLARVLFSRRRIETEDPSLDLINYHLCAGEHFARFLGGRLNGVARITKYPGVLTQVNNSVHKLFQTGIELCCLAAQPAKVMCLGKWHIGPDKKGLESLLDRLLAMENGILSRRRLCRQVDSGVAQVVRRFT
jgi:hypothetical protein